MCSRGDIQDSNDPVVTELKQQSSTVVVFCVDNTQTCNYLEGFGRNEIKRLEDGPILAAPCHDELLVHFVNIAFAILTSAVVQQSWRISHFPDSHSLPVRDHTIVLN